MEKSVRIFISYAHEDEPLRRNLEKHLASLSKQGSITIWHDRNISAGKEWSREVDTFLNTADLVLLLISSDFLASEYCYSIEIQQAIARHNAGNVRVIPIILRHVSWKTTVFGQLQALPTNAEPVVSSYWHTPDEALLNVANGIQKVVEELRIETIPALPNSKSFQTIVPIRLPRPATLIGREAELDMLMEQLRVGETSSIYALNGMGGAGKTALAAEVVGRLLQEKDVFPGGAVWIFCEGLEDEKGLIDVWRQLALSMRLEHIIKRVDEIQRIIKRIDELEDTVKRLTSEVEDLRKAKNIFRMGSKPTYKKETSNLAEKLTNLSARRLDLKVSLADLPVQHADLRTELTTKLTLSLAFC